jgi:AcrR family transcriptional regulator
MWSSVVAMRVTLRAGSSDVPGEGCPALPPLTSERNRFTLRTVSGIPNIDRKTVRRQQTRAEIVAAAWDLVREEGLAGLSMRDLGHRVGMRAQSIYSYFSSKHEIFDAMFLEGYQDFADWMSGDRDDEVTAPEPVAGARRSVHDFVEFCTSDPVRYQLLFQRTIPGFTPSTESWTVAVQAYEQMRERLSAVGVDDQETLDLWTAVMTGLTDQQISNDPGGTRWVRLVDRAIDMLLLDTRSNTPTTRAR